MRPRGQQFALGFARARIETLRFPVKVGAIRSCLDEIQAAWEEEDLRQFPLNLVHGELAGLSAWLAHEHDDLDQEVDSKSAAYDWVLNLQHRLRMSTEFVVASRVYEDVERQYRRIDERPEYARLVLCLTLQLAAEVGILLGHQRKGV